MCVLIYFIATEPNSEQESTYLMDPDLTWPEVEEIWKKTVNFRQHFIKENNTRAILDKWHHYTRPMGYKLVSPKILFNKLILN